jgi:hypothetical protein
MIVFVRRNLPATLVLMLSASGSVAAESDCPF